MVSKQSEDLPAHEHSLRRNTRVSENEVRDGRRGLQEGGLANDPKVPIPRSLLRRRGRPVLHADRDCKGEDGGDDRNETDPSEPGDLSQRLHAGEQETNDGAHGNEDGRAGCVERDGVQSDGSANDGRANDKDHD